MPLGLTGPVTQLSISGVTGAAAITAGPPDGPTASLTVDQFKGISASSGPLGAGPNLAISEAMGIQASNGPAFVKVLPTGALVAFANNSYALSAIGHTIGGGGLVMIG
jgi:hypothetical protein